VQEGRRVEIQDVPALAVDAGRRNERVEPRSEPGSLVDDGCHRVSVGDVGSPGP